MGSSVPAIYSVRNITHATHGGGCAVLCCAGRYDAVVRLYIDEDAPMTLTLLELANIGDPTGMASLSASARPHFHTSMSTRPHIHISCPRSHCRKLCALSSLSLSLSLSLSSLILGRLVRWPR